MSTVPLVIVLRFFPSAHDASSSLHGLVMSADVPSDSRSAVSGEVGVAHGGQCGLSCGVYLPCRTAPL